MLEQIHRQLAGHPDVTLVAVSKYHPVEALRRAYGEGQRVFGESRVQELLVKREAMPADVEWHFIGHLQRNKVRQIAPFIGMIHSIDTERLLEEVSRQATAAGRVIDVLLQLHVAEEDTKFGFSVDECRTFLASGRWKDLTGVRLRGLMCMATNTDDADRIRHDFRQAAALFHEMAPTVDSAAWNVRSWGMSSDFPIALEEEATHIRVGSLIFGTRG
ncbi:MAG: YggS family pyridoxal phosphate-dependent enzyme [Bacteroidales bacterium]|nr:YggS family pyridoxal phosphate-dependent enzyme [Candidatus Equimonas faecalis]